QGRVEMTPSVRHRRHGPPGRGWSVEIDYLRGRGRRVTASDEEDLPGVVEDGGSIIAVACRSVRDERPAAGAGRIEVSRRAARAAVENEPVRREMHARIKVERQLRIRQIAPRAIRGREHLRQ